MRCLLLFVCLIAGCSNVSGYEPDTTTIKAQVASQIAFHEPQPAKESAGICKKCNGTGTVLSGDGLAKVPCSCTVDFKSTPVTDSDSCLCGTGCKCKQVTEAEAGTPKQAEPVASNRMLMFTATWCGPCQQWKQANTEELKRQGWDLNSQPDAHIQMIDTDQNPGLTQQYAIQSIPCFVMIDSQGRELARYAGSGMNAVDTAELFYSNQPLPRSSYPQADGKPKQNPVETQPKPKQDQQTYYYETYQPTRRGRRFFSSGCSSGSCR